MLTTLLPRRLDEAVDTFIGSRGSEARAYLGTLVPGDQWWKAMATELSIVYHLDDANADLRDALSGGFPSSRDAADVIMRAVVSRVRDGTFDSSLEDRAVYRYRCLFVWAHLRRSLDHLHAAVEAFGQHDGLAGMAYIHRACINADHAFADEAEGRSLAIDADETGMQLLGKHAAPIQIVAGWCLQWRYPEVAMVMLRDHLAVEDRDAAAWSLLARAYRQSDDLLAEQRVHEHVIDRGFATASTWNMLGVCHFEQGQYNDAIHCYRRAIAMRPNYALAYNNMGESHYQRGEICRAMACYGLSISMDAEYHEVHRLLGDVYRDLGMREKFLACYRRAAELDDPLARRYLENFETA
jgi:tetratricopeptide (TPR) repeat protein